MQIKWTAGARLNLEHVESYIAQDNPSAAIETVLKIIEGVERLADYPALGRPGRVANTRELIVADTPFIVPYRVKGYVIEVLRVIHSARQWPSTLP